MKKFVLALAFVFGLPTLALAQAVTINTNNSPVSSTNPLATSSFPPSSNLATPTQATGTCGTSSGTILAAAAASSSMSFHLPLTAANPVWLNFAGATATAAAPNFDLQPGYTVTFTAASGLLPQTAVTCIATASTSVVEIYK